MVGLVARQLRCKVTNELKGKIVKPWKQREAFAIKQQMRCSEPTNGRPTDPQATQSVAVSAKQPALEAYRVG